ncbi:hypothetical protein GCM10009603_49900 [Nocardiopsis exhalans]
MPSTSTRGLAVVSSGRVCCKKRSPRGQVRDGIRGAVGYRSLAVAEAKVGAETPEERA